MFDDEDELDLVAAAESAETVRGEHFTSWWPEVERLEKSQQWVQYEALLGEMRDATERGAQLAGWTVAPAPSRRLAYLYQDRGDTDRAIAELERYLASVDQYRQVAPEGGDTGHRRALEHLAALKRQQG